MVKKVGVPQAGIACNSYQCSSPAGFYISLWMCSPFLSQVIILPEFDTRIKCIPIDTKRRSSHPLSLVSTNSGRRSLMFGAGSGARLQRTRNYALTTLLATCSIYMLQLPVSMRRGASCLGLNHNSATRNKVWVHFTNGCVLLSCSSLGCWKILGGC
jgi:hypothetical protein